MSKGILSDKEIIKILRKECDKLEVALNRAEEEIERLEKECNDNLDFAEKHIQENKGLRAVLECAKGYLEAEDKYIEACVSYCEDESGQWYHEKDERRKNLQQAIVQVDKGE